MSLGPVMVDIQATTLSDDERRLLSHPLVGAVILFTRNYESPQQLAELVREIHELREPQLLVAVDHEGGRVQRFRDGFTLLPPVRRIGDIYDSDKSMARKMAREHGWLMASELRAMDVDFSFAPVLDLDYGNSQVIGDRAFHGDADIVADLAFHYIQGMNEAGMAATGKHYPGHGYVAADSHTAIPEDNRELDQIRTHDMIPFDRLAGNGLAAVMPAHIMYRKIDRHPAGFSSYWLKEVLRHQLGFQGVIFSDDLSMEGATVAGSFTERAQAAMDAGCDMVLVCNNPDAAREVVNGLVVDDDPVSRARLARMHGRHSITPTELHRLPRWQQSRELLASLQEEPTLDLDFNA
ncbi:MAG: beta-N-acetylhexosaminidase [Gammaproteobacteria bacterium]|nr:beta-N-acetylhexosaminidase [Gammaproteobacteria bacterium]